MRRRKFLAGASVGIVVSVTGCLEGTPLVNQTEGSDGTDEDTSDDGPDQDISDNETEDGEYEYEAVEGEHDFDGGAFTIKQLGYEPRDLPNQPPHLLEYIADAQRALNYLDTEAAPEEFRTFIRETDFSRERLLLIRSDGSNPGYGYIMIRSFSLSDETLAGRAAGYAEQLYGGSAGARPAAFIRVTFDEKPVETAEFTIVEGQSPVTTNGKYIGGGREVTREASTQK